MKIAVIDYSMLRHIATAAVKKFQDQNAAEGHLKCITQKMSEILFSLRIIEKIDVMAFALDEKPYWRQQEMEAFYKRETEFWTADSKDTYWKAYGCLYKNEDGKCKKMTKKELNEIKEQLVDLDPDAFDEDAAEFPMPRYKGNRKPIDYSWLDCGAEKYFEFINALPMLYAKLMKGLVISLPGAEADDIAAIVSEKAKEKGNDVVLITGDSDWAQLAAYHENVEFYNPYRDQRLTFADREEVIHKTLVKIIGGDAGDGIKGCAHNTKWGPIGETVAEKIVTDKTWDEEIPKAYLDHNKRMVRLHTDTIPDDIVAGVTRVIAEQRKSSQDVTWEDLQLSVARQGELEVESKAKELWNQVTEK